MDLLLDSSGDLDISTGTILTCTDGEEAAQRIGMAIDLNLGEFFTHVNYGLPWIENQEETFAENIRFFLGGDFPASATANYIATTLDEYITSLGIVDTLESSYTYDSETREFTYEYTVVTKAGEEIVFEPYIQTIS